MFESLSNQTEQQSQYNLTTLQSMNLETRIDQLMENTPSQNKDKLFPNEFGNHLNKEFTDRNIRK